MSIALQTPNSKLQTPNSTLHTEKGGDVTARLYPLFSSSKGNCTYVGSKESGILIDCGVSFRRLCMAFEINGLSLNAVKGVFITHEHGDHTSGLKMLTKKTGVPVFAQSYTLDLLCSGDYINPRSYYEEIKLSITAGDMEIECFSTPHDTKESCGYKITFRDGKTCAVCTDLGHVTETVEKKLLGTDAVLLESNYDIEMLRNGSYPYYLKTRIFSRNGHLSNSDCTKFAAKLVRNGTTRLVLGHLSQENNTPAIAEETAESGLGEFKRNSDYILSIAPVQTAGGFVSF